MKFKFKVIKMLKYGTIAKGSNSLYIPTEIRADFGQRKVKLVSAPKLLLIFPEGLDKAALSANLKFLRKELELRTSTATGG